MTPKPHVKPRVSRMNGAESAYALGLEARRRAGEIQAYWYEDVTLRLGPDCRLTIDFMVIAADGEVQFHEVKGRMREDAAVKLRACLGKFPFRIFLNGKEFQG